MPPFWLVASTIQHRVAFGTSETNWSAVHRTGYTSIVGTGPPSRSYSAMFSRDTPKSATRMHTSSGVSRHTRSRSATTLRTWTHAGLDSATMTSMIAAVAFGTMGASSHEVSLETAIACQRPLETLYPSDAAVMVRTSPTPTMSGVGGPLAPSFGTWPSRSRTADGEERPFEGSLKRRSQDHDVTLVQRVRIVHAFRSSPPGSPGRRAHQGTR